jgi:hypothetical protein
MGLQLVLLEFAEVRSRFNKSDIVFDGGGGVVVACMEEGLE